MGYLSVAHLINLNLEFLSYYLVHFCLQTDLLRFKLVQSRLLCIQRLCLLFYLRVHLLGILLILLNSFDYLIFEDLHAAFEFPNPFW